MRGRKYLVHPIGPGEPRRIAEAAGEPAHAREFAPSRWVLGLAAAEVGGEGEEPGVPLGFYALAHSGDPTCYDDTLIFVRPEARGRDLSFLLIYAAYGELLRTSLSFRLREATHHPRLRLFARCGFAPPVRPLVDGKVEVGNFDVHAILSRIESEAEIVDVSLTPLPPPVH
ncbi:MAG: GNAT family N-acetyltransferase [Deferrisomatales bacterium]|nr:GNAT family N-acetyltransferase [Deferrisomatales bacterium]